jgi:phosphoserine phosphatase
MFREAGLSIAFNADDHSVEEAADVVVKRKDLREILPYLTERV